MQGNALLEEALRAHNAGRAQDAARLYQHVLKYDPNDRVALGNLARLFGESRQYSQCEELLHRLTALAPGDLEACVNLGTILHEQGKFDAAIEACRRALKLSAENKQAQNTLAASLAGAGKYEEATALLERILKKRPGYAKGYAYLGTILAKQGRHEEAVRHFARATEIDPKDAVSLVAAAECLLLLGRAEDALERLERALRLDVYEVRGLALKTLALAETGRTEEEKWLSDPQRLILAHKLSDLGYGAERVAALNRGLAEFAVSEPSMREDPPEYATYRGWHTTRNLADYRNDAVDELKRFAAHGFEQRLASLAREDPAHPLVRSAPKDFHLDLWSVRLQSGGKMLPHIHTSGWLSGVYYVDIPSVVDDPNGAQAGWIRFGAPRADIHLTKSPITRTVKPEPGLMLTFPSYFWHATIPLPESGEQRRLCFSFDYQMRGA